MRMNDQRSYLSLQKITQCHNQTKLPRAFLKCMYLPTNVDGLNAVKGKDFSLLMRKAYPQVLFIVETKLSKDDGTHNSVYRL